MLQLCRAIEEDNDEEFEFIILPNWKKANESIFFRGRVNLIKKVMSHLSYFFWKELILPIHLLIRKADLVVAPDYVLPYFKFGKASIAVIHDIFYWELKDRYNPVWRVYYLFLIRMGLNSKSSLVVTSSFIKEEVKSKVFGGHPIHVVYQAPKELGPKAKNHDLSINGLPSNAKYFLHIGTHERRKSLETLVKAFEIIIDDPYYSDFYLLLVGSPSVTYFDKAYEKLVELVKNSNLEQRVIFTGFVPDDSLPSIYNNAFCYVFPSLEEGFGIPILEAGNAGLPIIISNQEALIEIAGDAAQIFSKGDHIELSERMLMLKDEDYRQMLIERASTRSKKFTKENFLHQFKKAFLSSVNTNK